MEASAARAKIGLGWVVPAVESPPAPPPREHPEGSPIPEPEVIETRDPNPTHREPRTRRGR